MIVGIEKREAPRTKWRKIGAVEYHAFGALPFKVRIADRGGPYGNRWPRYRQRFYMWSVAPIADKAVAP